MIKNSLVITRALRIVIIPNYVLNEKLSKLSPINQCLIRMRYDFSYL